MSNETGEGGGAVFVGGGEGGAAAEAALKTLGRAMTATVTAGSTTYYPIAKSLPRALSIAYAAVFLTILLFLAILLLLLLLRLSRPSGSGSSDEAGSNSAGGCGGGGAVEFAKRATVAVMFLVPVLVLPAGAYAILNSKANVG